MPSPDQLLQIIRIQTEIAKLGLGLGDIMDFVVAQTPALIGADGAAVELAVPRRASPRARSACA